MEIRLLRNTHVPQEGVPETEWELQEDAPETQAAWNKYGLIGSLLRHTKAFTIDELYTEVLLHERNIPAEVSGLLPDYVLKGVASLIEAGLAVAIVVEDGRIVEKGPETAAITRAICCTEKDHDCYEVRVGAT